MTTMTSTAPTTTQAAVTTEENTTENMNVTNTTESSIKPILVKGKM